MSSEKYIDSVTRLLKREPRLNLNVDVAIAEIVSFGCLIKSGLRYSLNKFSQQKEKRPLVHLARESSASLSKTSSAGFKACIQHAIARIERVNQYIEKDSFSTIDMIEESPCAAWRTVSFRSNDSRHLRHDIRRSRPHNNWEALVILHRSKQ